MADAQAPVKCKLAVVGTGAEKRGKVTKKGVRRAFSVYRTGLLNLIENGARKGIQALP
jgi:hypothetical protein